jgi:putative membrane protein
MLKRTFSMLAVLCFAAGCGGPSMTQLGGKPSPEIMKSDNTFFKNMAEMNMLEVQSSQLEIAQTQNLPLKSYAQQMVTDHSAANSKVIALAAKKQVELPTELGPDEQKSLDNLKSKTGLDLDKAYIDLQVAAHNKVIAIANDEVLNGGDPEVRDLANHIQDSANVHLRMAEQLQGSR